MFYRTRQLLFRTGIAKDTVLAQEKYYWIVIWVWRFRFEMNIFKKVWNSSIKFELMSAWLHKAMVRMYDGDHGPTNRGVVSGTGAV